MHSVVHLLLGGNKCTFTFIYYFTVPDGDNAGRRSAEPGRDVMSWHNCRGGFLRTKHERMLRGIALPDAVATLQQRAVRGSFLLPENKINLPVLRILDVFISDPGSKWHRIQDPDPRQRT
jgi:hypothetical protein